MRKTLLLIGIAAWALVLIIVVVIVIINVQRGSWPWESDAQLLKEEQLDIADAALLTVKTDAMDIELLAGTGDQLLVRQYGVNSSSLFLARADNGGVTIQARQKLRIGFHLPHDERLEIEIPQSWLGNVTAEVSSGRLRLNDAFTWQDVALTSSSGIISVEQPLTAAKLRLGSNSGSIRVLAELNVAGECDIEANSGGIHLEQAVGAQRLFCHTSSGSVRLANITAEQFELRASSGSIHAAGLSGSGSALTNSGAVDVNLRDPLGDVSLRASSGRINITVPPELNFNFEGSCSSGSIHADFPVEERDKGKQVSGSVGANPTVTIQAEVNSGSIHISRD